MQSILRYIYPSQCLTCSALVESEMGLCGACWRKTPFIHGLTCKSCGVALPGTDDGEDVQCNDCMTIDRPWRRGVAAVMYQDHARHIVLGLKYADRTDLARPLAGWISRKIGTVSDGTCIVPVPMHWRRRVGRRYNQAALLAQHIARDFGVPYLPDALLRPQATAPLDRVSPQARFVQMKNAILPNPKQAHRLSGRAVIVVDDVMTSGATLSACTRACFEAGARQVDIAVLARVAKDD